MPGNGTVGPHRSRRGQETDLERTGTARLRSGDPADCQGPRHPSDQGEVGTGNAGCGAAIGGGFNAYFTAKVCDAARYLYRERFLAEKYGPGVIEVTVKPAEDIDPQYPEEAESIPCEGQTWASRQRTARV